MRAVVLCSLLAACSTPKAKVIDAALDGDGIPIPSDGTSPDADPACPTPAIPPFTARPVVTGLARPVYLTAPRGSTDLYVVEEVGYIRIIRDGVALPTPFLDVTAQVYSPGGPVEGEAGLLGLAFDPDYATTGRFFVYLTTLLPAGEGAGLYEYRRSANPDVATPTPVKTILEHRQNTYANIGGHLAFGPDGKLYAGIGDGASVPSAAADPTSPRGKLDRFDIAQPNPALEIKASGLRNPYRFSFDRATGALYLADAGEEHFDEISIDGSPTDPERDDYGWPRVEGTRCEGGAATCPNMGIAPKHVIAHAPVSSVAIGGAVYRGAAMPCLRGRYFYAMYGLGTVFGFVWNGTAVADHVELTDRFGSLDLFSVSSISEDAAGELYITTLPGAIYRLEPL